MLFDKLRIMSDGNQFPGLGFNRNDAGLVKDYFFALEYYSVGRAQVNGQLVTE